MTLTPCLRLYTRLCLLALGLSLLSERAAAQPTSGTIEGRVFNTRNGEYLEKARVTIEGARAHLWKPLLHSVASPHVSPFTRGWMSKRKSETDETPPVIAVTR